MKLTESHSVDTLCCDESCLWDVEWGKILLFFTYFMPLYLISRVVFILMTYAYTHKILDFANMFLRHVKFLSN